MRPVSGTGLLVLVAATACARPASRAPVPALQADTVRVATLARGVTHTYAWDKTGPWAIHVIKAERAQCEPVLSVRKRGTDLRLRAPTSELAAGAIATINADFFAIPSGNPVGAHVSGGRVLAGPHATRPLFAVSNGRWWIGTARLDGFAATRADSVRITELNRARGNRAHALVMFSSALGDSLPRDSMTTRIWLRRLAGDEMRGRAVVTRIDSAAHELKRDSSSWVLYAHGRARAWADRRAAGDTVSWSLALNPAADEATGGFPELLRAGAPVELPATPFAQDRHPRTAIGWTADQRALLLVIVDGRQPPYSAGMSLAELTALFQRLGASDALNLDGGGSTTLVIGGKIVNRPSDAGRERPVGNALALSACRG